MRRETEKDERGKYRKTRECGDLEPKEERHP
jgi:hypothetical protein